MDLRRRLLGWLGWLLAGLMIMALLIQLSSLREDIAAEISASQQLVDLLLAADNNDPELPKRLQAAHLRHLQLSLSPPATPPASPGWLNTDEPAPNPARQLRIGGRTLYIAANPQSEIEERKGDTVRLMITLLLYSGATLLAAWWATDRALRPVRELEAGLHRLAAGEHSAALPDFSLREFRRVAQAIETLAASLKTARSAQKALARQLISVQEDERRALARELHDEMGQTLTAINATAAHLERNAARLPADAISECCRDLRRDIRMGSEQLRAMLKSLRPHGLDAEGLPMLLRELIEGWRNRGTGIDFAIEIPDAFPEIDDEAALTLYRVVQEGLTNVVRHSQARHCWVMIQLTATDLAIEIIDDGIGFLESTALRQGGLLGMAERLEMAGGKLDIGTPRRGHGLRLAATLPWRVREALARGETA